MFNSFGNIFRLTSFGESHGPGVGGVIDGFPAGIDIDMDFVQKELNRRRPGQSLLTTSRKEPDTVEFLSGIFDGKSTGCPIGFVVWNKNQHSNDYENPPFACGLYLYGKIRHPRLSRRRTFISTRNNFSCCGRFTCQTCLKAIRHQRNSLHLTSGTYQAGP